MNTSEALELQEQLEIIFTPDQPMSEEDKQFILEHFNRKLLFEVLLASD